MIFQPKPIHPSFFMFFILIHWKMVLLAPNFVLQSDNLHLQLITWLNNAYWLAFYDIRPHWLEILFPWMIWFVWMIWCVNFDLESCTSQDQGYLYIQQTLTLSLVGITNKATYLICWKSDDIVLPFGLADWIQPTFMICFLNNFINIMISRVF